MQMGSHTQVTVVKQFCRIMLGKTKAVHPMDVQPCSTVVKAEYVNGTALCPKNNGLVVFQISCDSY
jgi:hypothetical protein